MTETNDHCCQYYIDAHHLTGVAYGLDIGGSLAKIAYVTKEKDNSSGKVCIRTKVFPKDSLDELVEFLSHHADLGTPQSTVAVTGIGCNKNKSRLEKALDVKLNILIEFDCFARTLVWGVKHLPLSKVVCPPDEGAITQASNRLKAWAGVKISPGADEKSDSSTCENSKDTAIDMDWCYITEESHDYFPCLVVMIGSGVGYYIVTETKQHYLIGGTANGGKTLTALSKLLTGTQDFNELMDLAARGLPTEVDTCGRDLSTTGEDTSFYMAFPENESIYFMGQVNELKGPFKNEDLAASLVGMFCYEYVNMIQTTARLHKLKRVFFAGSVPQHPYFRHTLETEMLAKSVMMDQGTKDMKFGFLQNCGQLGALGTILL